MSGDANSLMLFLGKWTLATPDKKNFITLKKESRGDLTLEPVSKPAGPQYFNTYGGAASGFWFQASNWAYVAYSELQNIYQADQARDGQLSLFLLEEVCGDQYRIIEQATDGSAYYLNANGNKLERIAKQTNPPQTTLFVQKVITPDLKELQTWGAMGANLTGAYLAGANLQDVSFNGSDLSYASLNTAKIKGAVFQGCTIHGTDFSNCLLDDVTLTGVCGTSPIFDGVTLFDGTELSGAIINKAQFQNALNQGKATMNNLTAEEAVFNGSDLRGVVCNGSTLTDTKFIKVNLSDAQMGSCCFKNAILTQINFQGASLQNSIFDDATLATADFSGADITGAQFKKANLANAKLSQANGITDIDITGASLVGAILKGLDLRSVKIDSQTNFTQAQMESVDLTQQNLNGVNFLRANLKKAKLDKTSLEKSVLVGTILSFGSITGDVSFIGANLSNASLDNVDLSGAQMGSIKQVSTLAKENIVVLNAGNVPKSLQKQHMQLAGSAEVTVREPDEEWVIRSGRDTLFVQNSGDDLQVYQTDGISNGAVLVNAYMPNAILTGANLYAVDMSGVQWYGSKAKADNANLEQANLSNANLATMDFTQAKMYGANLSFANLVNTVFRKARLAPTQGLKPASLAFASMQGADFTEAQLSSANLTNAAISIEIKSSTGNLTGDSLFSIDVSLGQYLDQGEINDGLIEAFSQHQTTLTKDDCLTIVLLGSMWLIKKATFGDGDFSQFILVRNEENSNIQVFGDTSDNTSSAQNTQIPFGSFTAVPLFQLDTTFIKTLDQSTISDDLKTAFSDSGYSLVDNACLTIIQQGTRWTINNTDRDHDSLQSGYSQFTLVKKSVIGLEYIVVYGTSPLHVVRTGSGNELTMVRIAFGPTIFPEGVLTDDITCPSGLKYDMLHNGISYEDLMTPGLPPHPPVCIPSPTHWC